MTTNQPEKGEGKAIFVWRNYNPLRFEKPHTGAMRVSK
jgi:hypothetical protein